MKKRKAFILSAEEVIRIAREAVAERFLNYDWYEEAEEAARRIAAGDVALARRIARAAKMLPEYARPFPFLYWQSLREHLKR